MTYEVLDYLKKSGQAIKIQAKVPIKFKIYQKIDKKMHVNEIWSAGRPNQGSRLR